MHRLETPVQMSAVNNLGEGTNDIRLKPEVHGQVRIVPVTKHTHAHEIGFLGIHLLARIVATVLPEFTGSHFVAGLANLFFNVQLNRQTVTIPPGHIGRIKSRQRLGFDDDVLENLIDRVAHVEVTVCIRGAIVKDELWLPLPHLANLGIEVHLRPGLQAIGFTLREIRLHRKICLRQIQRGFVVTHRLSVVRQPGAGAGLVRRNALLQGIQRRKLLLVSQFMSKPHRQSLAI